ncbi:MAG: hypothetical protein HWN66_16905 [Candidatus Helarchaeota archaeon]|nr:hypothetical protein [Candidatus Helarchaeota archaeon]
MTWVSYYPFFGILFIVLGSIAAIWFLVHIEKGFRFSGLKSAIAIILLSVFFAFGIQFLLVAFGATG